MDTIDKSVIVRLRQGLIFGYCLNILFYGILTVQTYLYYLAFPNDRKITKAIVTLVYTIDTAQIVLAFHDLYRLFCVIYKNVDLFRDAYYSSFIWLTVPLSSTMIAATVQCFYAYRIYVLSKKKIAAVFIIILALAEVSFGVFSTLTSYGRVPMHELSWFWTVNVGWGVLGTVNDLIIVVYMTRFLTTQMKHSTRRATQTTLTKIKRLIMETGLLTVFFMVAYVFLSFVSEGQSSPGLPLAKVYSNSMLVLLNNRSTIEGGRNEPILEFDIQSYHLSDVHREEMHRTGTSPAEAD